MKDVFEGLCACTKDDLSAFNFLGTDGIRKICGYFQHMKYRAGETLWEEGDSCDYVAFIVSGRVEVKKRAELKGNQIVLGIYGKGSYVGALCILDGSPRAVTAEALDDACVVVITRENFDRLTEQYPDLGTALMKGMLLSVSKRLKSSFDRLVAIF